AVRRRARARLHRCPRARAGDLQALRLSAAFRRRRESTHLRLAALAVGLHPKKPHDLSLSKEGFMSRSRLAALLLIPLAFMLMGGATPIPLADPEPISV